MSKLCLILLACIISTSALFSQEKERVAVIPFSSVSETEGESISKMFAIELSKRNRYVIVTSSAADIKKILGLQNLLGDIVSDKKSIATIGRNLRTKYIISGTLTQRNASKDLSVSMVNVETLEKKTSDIKNITKIEDALNYIPSLIDQILPQKTRDKTVTYETLKNTINARKSQPGISEIENLLETGINTGLTSDVKIGNEYFGFGTTPLIIASAFGYLDIVSLLVDDNTLNINAQNNLGNSSLMYASRNGYIEIMRTLMASKADLDARNNNGWTAVMYAVREGKLSAVKELINAKADVKQYDKDGMTALMLSAKLGQSDITRELVKTRSDINTKDNSGKTALMYAVINGKTDILSLMISAGGDVNIKDNDKWNALMYAAASGKTEIINLIISAKGDVNSVNNYGQTALIIASKGGYKNAVIALIKGRADLNVKTYNGQSALSVSADDDIRKILQDAGAMK